LPDPKSVHEKSRFGFLVNFIIFISLHPLKIKGLLTERCQSGRTYKLGKFVYLKGYRGFESHPLRQQKVKAPGGLYFFWGLNEACLNSGPKKNKGTQSGRLLFFVEASPIAITLVIPPSPPTKSKSPRRALFFLGLNEACGVDKTVVSKHPVRNFIA
jgi:hypothetical protein